jgi:hypothetical protein
MNNLNNQGQTTDDGSSADIANNKENAYVGNFQKINGNQDNGIYQHTMSGKINSIFFVFL